jgi:hypothetical protein
MSPLALTGCFSSGALRLEIPMTMPTPSRIQGLHHALALMRLAYAHDPDQARTHIEAWIANLEESQVDPLHIRQMRNRLQALTGEAAGRTPVVWIPRVA